ncbi:MAG: DUF5804 family protein [Halobacteriaceae archaeon]
MTRVCIVGKNESIRESLLSYETARRALSAYDIAEPFNNAIAIDTVSLGAAISLLNDLDWYLARTAKEAWVREPSIDEEEWLSRDLATAIRDGAVDPEGNHDRRVYKSENGTLTGPVRTSPDIDPNELEGDDGIVIVRGLD